MGKGSRSVHCWEVVPFSEGPLSEVPLLVCSKEISCNTIHSLNLQTEDRPLYRGQTSLQRTDLSIEEREEG